jgi:hypothetical protein
VLGLWDVTTSVCLKVLFVSKIEDTLNPLLKVLYLDIQRVCK